MQDPSYREVLAAVPNIIAEFIRTQPEPTVHMMVFLAGEECLQEVESALRKMEGLPELEILCIFAGV
jgi:ABC-type arginine transport system permease subunit